MVMITFKQKFLKTIKISPHLETHWMSYSYTQLTNREKQGS